ncbi:hypothetical protein pipiens_018733 [Culex pipiens pipiens]|uniref:60S ribosomal export protein NMD3 n=1 Tax=Culex pipiens pipiens TaxID=38569 RepID=A0ABD1DYM6_CULPP
MFVLRVWKSCKAIVFFCRNCERFLIPPSEWDQCSLETKELLSVYLKRQSRNWKLKHLTEEDALDTDIKEDCNEFLEDLEEDPEMRQNVDIFKDAARQQSMPVDVNDMADPSVPRITLEELLDDLLLTVAQYGQALRDTVSVKQPHSKLSNLLREYIKQVHKQSLCCECVTCLRTHVDITANIPKQAIVFCGRNCVRYLNPPSEWVQCSLESKELLVDAGFIWTEPHSKPDLRGGVYREQLDVRRLSPDGGEGLLVDFVQAVLPVKVTNAKKLIPHDIHSNSYNYKYSYELHVVPISKGSLVCLGKKLQKLLWHISPITKVAKAIHLIDPSERCPNWAHTRAHLGHLLKVGDSVLGYDLAEANNNNGNFEKLKLDAMHKQSRNWKLKHQVGRAGHGPRGGLQRVPTGPRGGSGMRQKVNIFKKAARQQSVDVNDIADKSVPRITLEELLDDLVLDDFEMENSRPWLKYIRDGWPSSAESVTNSEVLLYFHRRESLSLVDGCVIFHKRVVVPNQFRHQIPRQFHCGHPAVDRMKAIARSFVYSTRSGAIRFIRSRVRGCSCRTNRTCHSRWNQFLEDEDIRYLQHLKACQLVEDEDNAQSSFQEDFPTAAPL